MDKKNSKWTLVIIFAAGLILGNLCAVGLFSQASAQQGTSASAPQSAWAIIKADIEGCEGDNYVVISPNGTLDVVGVTRDVFGRGTPNPLRTEHALAEKITILPLRLGP